MGKFNFEDYRQRWETGPHWELKKEFIETYQDMFEEDRLLCLAQAYANVVLMTCCYPDPVMRQISELSKPLQMRKKFQGKTENSNNTETTPPKRDKIKSVPEQSGRPFKQIKFCASKEQCSLTFSPDSANLYQSSREQFQSSSPLSLCNQQDTKSLLQTPMIPSLDVISVSNQQGGEPLSPQSVIPSVGIKKEVLPFLHCKNNNKSSEKEKNEKIISELGLSFIQNFAHMKNKFTTKIEHPVGAIHCIIEKLGLGKDYCFEIDVDPTSSKNALLYNSKFFIKNCEIASGTACNKKNAKKLCAEVAINTLYKLATSHISSSEDICKSDILNSNLSQPCTETYVEKSPFILNQRMYDLSVRDGFVLVEKENYKAELQKNERIILHNSASFNHKAYEYIFEEIPGTMPPSKKAVLIIAGAIVGTGVSNTKEEAKAIASVRALNDLKKKYYTLRIKEEYVEGFIVTRNQVFDGESYSSNVISESNIGCKMLKSMGWTGGGLGGKGIAEPIEATAKLSLGSGLGFGGSKERQNLQLFRKRLGAMLREFCKSENYSDLVFSKDFTKEERKEIHQLACRLHLHTQSRGVDNDRFLTIRQRYETSKLLKFLANNGGSNSKFQLVDDSKTSLQA